MKDVLAARFVVYGCLALVLAALAALVYYCI